MFRAVLFLLGLLVGACTQAAVQPPPPPQGVSVQALEDQTVALAQRRPSGAVRAYCSGVWVSKTSILTAAHCIADEPEVEYVVKGDVYASNGYEERQRVELRKALVVTFDGVHDLALLKAQDPPAHMTARVRLEGIFSGAKVYTMGHPLGLWWSFSSGDIAGVRSLDLDPELIYVQTTAPTSPGNSGCGLFDSNGFLIGIAHAGMPRGSNLAFYVHGRYVQDLLKGEGANL